MKCLLVVIALAAMTGLASAQEVTGDFTAPFILPGTGDELDLVLKAPLPAKLTSTNGYSKLARTNLELYVWAVPGAKTVAQALPRAAAIITNEFINFKPSATNDVQIAGAPAKDLTGPGNEADDQDPGNAEVVLFTVNGYVFAGCVHGEFDNAKPEHAPMLAVLNSAKVSYLHLGPGLFP